MSAAPFQPSDKVVCVDDSPHQLTPQLGKLVKDRVYCVEWCLSGGRFWWVRLVGDPFIINPVTVRYPPAEPYVWGCHRFRSIWEQKVSVSATVEQEAGA